MTRFALRIAAVAVIALAVWSYAARSEGALAADPSVQRAIERVVATIVAVAEGGDTREVEEAIRRLEVTAGEDRPTLLLQLAIYLSSAEGTERAMGAALLLDHLAFSPAEIVEVAAPALGTDDRGLDRMLRQLLGTVDRPDGGAPDFEAYREFLRDRAADPPVEFIDYLYTVSAPLALSVLTDAYVAEPAERARIIAAAGTIAQALDRTDGPSIEEARVQLDLLSRDRVWWVRLFAKKIARVAPELGSPALLARLETDEHPSVRSGPDH